MTLTTKWYKVVYKVTKDHRLNTHTDYIYMDARQYVCVYDESRNLIENTNNCIDHIYMALNLYESSYGMLIDLKLCLQNHIDRT